MFSTYEDYRSQPMCLTLDEMTALHREMAEEAGGDSDAMELYGELLAAAVKYFDSRAHWPLWSQQEKAENDKTRSLRHDKVIIAFNQLARYLRMQGNAAAWREALGEEKEDPNCRKRIGDFACYLVFVESLNAR
ncbi:MAG: hypothetical protein NC430_13495 [bacterium]|nr:hypothetical protein [bacterium]